MHSTCCDSTKILSLCLNFDFEKLEKKYFQNKKMNEYYSMFGDISIKKIFYLHFLFFFYYCSKNEHNSKN